MKMEPEDETEKEFQNLMFDVKYDKEQFKDPETIGLLLYRLSKERKKTNHLFKEISSKLKEIEEGISSKELAVEKEKPREMDMLSKTDEKVYDYVQRNGKVDAANLKEEFGYKGRNAASARLNSLYKKGFLNKERVGKRVLYWVKG
ncbi:MAG: hypothetical protein ACOCTT_01930 [archaeon]